MQSSRLKNIIILILLLANLALAAVVASRQVDRQDGLKQVRQQLVTLFPQKTWNWMRISSPPRLRPRAVP